MLPRAQSYAITFRRAAPRASPARATAGTVPISHAAVEAVPPIRVVKLAMITGRSDRRKKDLTASLRTIVTDIEDRKDS
ncbi:hypothetical protein GCM10009828_045170 [Actinoplanes couchii]|uniref:Uncharacterized protein n=1 Tax=Actinoplanes couchii TaxID=403638 RepID=A0ABQ3X772_9ACTN|nr:hypothetical protein Aco03nite_027690 [Actinoplanes couchii]